MTRPRKELISLTDTSYYHCINRCVRRAFLCGVDHLTGKDYEHRKLWVVDRLALLADVFAIDVAAYAVMSNHLHLVLRVDAEKAEQWSVEEIIERWSRLHRLPQIIQRFKRGEADSKGQRDKALELLTLWRTRLMDISWFMRSLNEHLARRANQEDQCTGRFWEGRFKSQALLDEAAVLTCMSYVDLNPIRAKIAATPETSAFTSIQQRIQTVLGVEDKQNQSEDAPSRPTLMPLIPASQDPHQHTTGFTESDYLELVDWAGRSLAEGKRGAIPTNTPPILHRLGLDPEGYLDHVKGKPNQAKPRVIGHASQIRKAAEQLGQRFLRGLSDANRLYAVPS